MDENNVDKPLLSWSDSSPFPGIDTIGLSTVGSAVFYKIDCSLGAAFPNGACAEDLDCRTLANTECRMKTLRNNSVLLRSCQCIAGYQQIPGKLGIHLNVKICMMCSLCFLFFLPN